MAGKQKPSSLGEVITGVLREEGARSFDAAVGRLAQGAGGALTHMTDQLADIAENEGRLPRRGRSGGIGGISAVASLLGLGEPSVKGLAAGKAKDVAKSMTGGNAKDDAEDKASGGSGDSSGGGIKPGDTKVTSMIEVLDIGVPLRTVYDYWTQYEEFGDVVKGVQSVTKDDDVTSKWKVKIAFSNRSFESTVQEQVPDKRIVWTSEGSKGSTNGVVSFHELAPALTRIVVVVEYYPSGFFEKTGNLWRAQGRRLRLDLKHFQRYVTLTQEEPEGWRGEIRDGEVVRTDEEVRDEEESAESEDDGGEYADDADHEADDDDRESDDEAADEDREFEDEDESTDDDQEFEDEDEDDGEDDDEEYEDEADGDVNEDVEEDERAAAR